MDTFIAGIVIVVVLGVLVALVRCGADKKPARRALSQADIVDADIAGDSPHRTLADFAGEDPIDIDFGH